MGVLIMKIKTENRFGTLLLAAIFMAIIIFLFSACKTTQKSVSNLEQKIDSTEVLKINEVKDVESVKIDSTKVVTIDKGTIIVTENAKITQIELDTTSIVLLSDILSGNYFVPVKGLKISETNTTTTNQKNESKEVASVKKESGTDKTKTDLKKDTKVKSETDKKDSAKKITEVDNGVYVVILIAIAVLALLVYLALKKWGLI